MNMAPSLSLRVHRPNYTLITSDPLLCFLVPSLIPQRSTPQTSVSRFSTSAQLWKRDNNPNRGISPMRHTGLRARQRLSVLKDLQYLNKMKGKPKYINEKGMPVPQIQNKQDQDQAITTDEDHPLWGFLNKNKAILATPEEDGAHGRAWTVQELRSKSWDDLHALWWICAKERNRLATEKKERKRIQAGYGDHESDERDQTVKRTMQSIMHVLTERWYSWEEARKVAKFDAEVDLSGRGPAFTPGISSEEEDFEDDFPDDNEPVESKKQLNKSKKQDKEPEWVEEVLDQEDVTGTPSPSKGTKAKEQAMKRSQSKEMPDDFFNRRSVL